MTLSRHQLYCNYRKEAAKLYNSEVAAAEAHAKLVKENILSEAKLRANQEYARLFNESYTVAKAKYEKAIGSFKEHNPLVQPELTGPKLWFTGKWNENNYMKHALDQTAKLTDMARHKGLTGSDVLRGVEGLGLPKNILRWTIDDLSVAEEWIAQHEDAYNLD